MIISGIDPSINGTGIYKMNLDDKTLEILDQQYLSFTQVKKNETPDVIYYKKKDFKNPIEQNIWMHNYIENFVQSSEYVAIEDYAYNAVGNVFQIGEFVGTLKENLYLKGTIGMRLYEPTVVKLFACNKGNSDKVSMCDQYDKLEDGQMDLSHLPQYKTPKEDIVDAYYICKLLRLELQLRKGIVQLNNLDETKIKIFNRCTKPNPINILGRGFIGED
jgi:hypothetical protein